MNNSGFYYCNEDDYNAAADTSPCEDEKWSYVCAWE
jgi:arginine decarboxylase